MGTEIDATRKIVGHVKIVLIGERILETQQPGKSDRNHDGAGDESAHFRFIREFHAKPMLTNKSEERTKNCCQDKIHRNYG